MTNIMTSPLESSTISLPRSGLRGSDRFRPSYKSSKGGSGCEHFGRVSGASAGVVGTLCAGGA